jgi:hypothetical protein
VSKPARRSASFTSASLAPSKTGVAIGTPRVTIARLFQKFVVVHAVEGAVIGFVAIGQTHGFAHRGQSPDGG